MVLDSSAVCSPKKSGGGGASARAASVLLNSVNSCSALPEATIIEVPPIIDRGQLESRGTRADSFHLASKRAVVLRVALADDPVTRPLQAVDQDVQMAAP